jgi:hypothetical protein
MEHARFIGSGLALRPLDGATPARYAPFNWFDRMQAFAAIAQTFWFGNGLWTRIAGSVHVLLYPRFGNASGTGRPGIMMKGGSSKTAGQPRRAASGC